MYPWLLFQASLVFESKAYLKLPNSKGRLTALTVNIRLACKTYQSLSTCQSGVPYGAFYSQILEWTEKPCGGQTL
jgi:hypothetical protein